MIYRSVLFISLLLFHVLAIAQTQNLSGTVFDAATKAPLAFVSITIKGSSTGSVTDIDGHFSFGSIPTNSVLLVSYIGYQPKEYALEKIGSATLEIFIDKIEAQMETVVISSNENPAHRIIRAMQNNKKQNDPESQPSFKYNAYTIAALASAPRFWNMNSKDTSNQKNQMAAMQKQASKLVEKAKDTIGNKRGAELGRRFKENYLLMTESYTERNFRFPKQSKEIVLATKVTGLKVASFGITAGDFQPFGFYKDYLKMGSDNYVNPVINGSISMYKFRLKEVIPHQNDTTFVITFKPRDGKNFKGLQGVIYINSDGYAIENIIASPSDEKGLIFTFKLQQKYEKVQGKWFPAQLNTILSQKDLKSDSVILYWDTRSYISNVVLNVPLSRTDFSDVKLEYHPLAGKRKDSAWARMRPDTLSTKAKVTYETYEMLPGRYKNMIEKANKAFQILAIEGIPWGKVDIPFKYILSGINKYESFRLGAGVQTNPSFSKWISVGGFGGYGIKDKAFKYGANLQLNLDKRTNTWLWFNYARDIEEPGNVNYFTENGTVFAGQSLRNFQRSRMDSIQQYKIEFATNLRPSVQSNIWLLNEDRNPAGYDYEYKDAATQFRSFKNTEVGIGFRLTRGESFTRMGRSKIRTVPATTQLLFQVSQGLNNVLNSNLNYTKVALQFNHSILFKKLGKTTFEIDAGQVWGNVPYSYLFNTKATRAGRVSAYVPNNFQTVGLYEFASSKSASLFVQHNFGSLLFKPKSLSFRPEILLMQHISYGSLDNAAAHKYINFKVPDKGLYESGVMIKNLYRKNLFSVVYLGLGAGVFYRYGYYALPKAIENWAFKWGFSISF
jgi:hypothetical protein